MKTTSKIPSGRYQGYIWMSDQSQPRVIDGQFEGMNLEPANPFVIEARLYDLDNRLSYAIHFHDGAYCACVYNVDELPQVEQSYIPSFKDAPGRLLFANVWREENDPLCEGMSVLVPCESIFIGYKK